MPLPLKRLLFVWLFPLVLFANGSPQNATGLEWYENFFLERRPAETEKAIANAAQKLQEATEIQDMTGVANASKILGLQELTRTHDYEKAITFLVRALAIEDSLGMEKEQVISYLGIAQVFEIVGDYPKSAALLEHAMNINYKFNDVRILVMIMNKLGRINAARGHIEEAFENYENVLKYQAELEEPKMEAEALFNMAHLFMLQGNFPKSLDYHKQALTIRRSIDDKKKEALSLNDIGELYRLMKNDEKSLANHVVSLEIRQAIKDQRGVAESFNNIGALYYHQKNFERAIANLKLGLEAAREAGDQMQILKSDEYLSLCFKESGDYKTALAYRDEFVLMTDLSQQEKNEQRLLDVQSRYEIGKKETQIEKLETIRAQREKQLRDEEKFRNILFALIGLGLVIVVLVLYLYALKRKSNSELKIVNDKVQQQNLALQELNATKDKFFSIISHDLKGPLNSLTSFSGLLINHTDSLSKEEITLLAKDLDKSLKNLFALLENLLEWSRSQTGNIEFKPEPFDFQTLLELNRELLNAQAQNKKINIINASTGNVTVHAHKHSVNTVVRNLISNAIKFTPEGGTITLDVKQEKELVTVSIADNGVGMSQVVMEKLFRIDTKHSTRGTADEKGTGLGLILCKEFIEKNGGTIWVESQEGKGSVFYFTLGANVSAVVSNTAMG
jgi:signal transduction histidine kinase